MSDVKKTPKLRFKGFTDDWEQRKLGDLANFYNGDRGINYPKPSDIVKNGVPFINAGDINQGNVDYHNCKHITKEKFNQLNGAKLRKNDIVYCLRGTIGKNGFINSTEDATIASSLVCIRPFKIMPIFLFQMLNSDVEERQRKMVDEGAAQPNISAANLKKFVIPAPSSSEQQKISNLLNLISKAITLQQRKLAKLNKLKKALLQKIFADKNNPQPLLRLKGFGGDWKQRKLGDLLTLINGRAYSQDELLEAGKYKVLRVGNFYTNDTWFYSNLELDDKYYANNGDLLYTWSATFGPHIWQGVKVIYHYHIWKIILSEGLQKLFTVQLLNKDKSEILANKNGSTMVHVTKRGMEQKSVLIPSSDEQKFIGSLLTKVDKAITLQQRKIDKLQSLKKSLLQNIFVN